MTKALGQDRKARRPFVVVVHGLTHFCRKLPELLQGDEWDVRDYSRHRLRELPGLIRDLGRCDLVYLWGGRISMGKFLWTARSLRKEKIIMFWSGSDVLLAQEECSARKPDPWIADRVHWAASATLAKEVRALGLNCEYVQASFVASIGRPEPLPKDFSVLLYVPSLERGALYGLDSALEVARTLPSVRFKIVGLGAADRLVAPPNVEIHGWVSDINPLLERSTVLWRPVRHDAGTSFMVLEALAQGRHVLYTYPHPGCVCSTTVEMARSEIVKFSRLHDSGKLELNRLGMEYVAHHCSRESVRADLLQRWEQVIESRDSRHASSAAGRFVPEVLPNAPKQLPRNSS
jgi:glycosyltransferase involved in cell wall biosynthesis